jgi:uncharacterized membrane protein YidH (DUF202 family)
MNRLAIWGIFSILFGLLANKIGKFTMNMYDLERKEYQKNVSIVLFSIGVVMIVYGIALIWLRNSSNMNRLSRL